MSPPPPPSPNTSDTTPAPNRRYNFINSRRISLSSFHSSQPLLSTPHSTPPTSKNMLASDPAEEDYRLLEAIDRQSTLSFSNQRGIFSPASIRKLELEALTRLMNRLARGEMSNQQADPEDTLFELYEKLLRANNRGLTQPWSTTTPTTTTTTTNNNNHHQHQSQRVLVSMDNRAGRELEQAKVDATLERMSRLRFRDQDWKSPSVLKEEELTLLINLLSSSPEDEEGEQWARQRVHLDTEQELDMFIAQIVGRSNRTRLVDQDALPSLSA